MANLSPEKQAVASLIASSLPGQRHGRFNPDDITMLPYTPDREIWGKEDEPQPVYMKGVSVYAAIPGVGNYSVALFGAVGPAWDRHNTEDMVHGQCDGAVVVRRPSDLESFGAKINYAQRGLRASGIMMLELFVPEAEEAGLVHVGTMPLPLRVSPAQPSAIAA